MRMVYIPFTNENVEQHQVEAEAWNKEHPPAKDYIEHVKGDLNCPGCREDEYILGTEYPKKCPKCDGLIHAEVDFGNDYVDPDDYSEIYPIIVKCENGCEAVPVPDEVVL